MDLYSYRDSKLKGVPIKLSFSPGKWDLGMHKWEYTPTYRGFDTFYGYYNAEEDYFTHSVGATAYPDPDHPGHLLHPHGIDFRSNKDPVTNENGTYSTNLFTKAIQDAITSHDKDKKPFFVYGAYQSVHTPLQVPDRYTEGECLLISYVNRKTFCGMMQALDEGIKNITATLEANGFLDNTIIIFSTDNGGQTASGSSNWPLRGNKATVFEGGVRGFSFVWGSKLPKLDYDNTALMHISDWYLTIVEGIAGLELSIEDTEKLDGHNMWLTITQDKPSPRSEILLQLNPPSPERKFVGQAALRSGEWKLITGEPSCTHSFNRLCPTGWVHLNGTVDMPPDNPSQVWLFNVTADPHEKTNLAETYPDVVSRLKQRLEEYGSTRVEQLHPPFDPRSDPKYFGGVWTPWID